MAVSFHIFIANTYHVLYLVGVETAQCEVSKFSIEQRKNFAPNLMRIRFGNIPYFIYLPFLSKFGVIRINPQKFPQQFVPDEKRLTDTHKHKLAGNLIHTYAMQQSLLGATVLISNWAMRSCICQQIILCTWSPFSFHRQLFSVMLNIKQICVSSMTNYVFFVNNIQWYVNICVYFYFFGWCFTLYKFNLKAL